MKSYIERIMEEHPNWPRRVWHGEYVGVLSGVQPLGGGEVEPIYRFPGGASLAFGAPAVRTPPTEDRGVLKCGCCGVDLLCDAHGNLPDICPACHEGVEAGAVSVKYVAKLHNYPIRWTVEAANMAEATQKAWEKIENDMDPDSVAAGGHIIVMEEGK